MSVEHSVTHLFHQAALAPERLAPDRDARARLAREHDEALRARGFAQGLLGAEDAEKALKCRVHDCMIELLEIMRALDLSSVGQVMHRYERLLAVNWVAMNPELCDVAVPDAIRNAVLDAENSIALRFCLEVAAAHAGSGTLAMADEVFHRAWCLAREVLYCGALQDGLKGRVTDVHVFEQARRLRLVADGRLETALGAQRDAMLAEGESDDDPLPPDPLTAELNAAVGEAVGVPLSEIVVLLQALMQEAQQHRSARWIERDKLIADWPAEHMSPMEVDSALEYLSLSSGIDFTPDPDRYPWRFRREHSYLTRPVLDLTRGGQRLLLWGPLSTEVGARSIVHGFPTKGREPKTKRLKDAIEALASWRAERLEQRIADHFRADGRFVVEQGVEKPLGSIVFYKPNHKLGDMDVVVIDPVGRLLVLIEAKGRVVALLPADIAHELREWRETDEKHERRLTWLTEHRTEFLRHRGFDDGQPQLWRVLGHIVVRAPMASVALAAISAPVSTLDEMLGRDRDAWLASGSFATAPALEPGHTGSSGMS